MPTLGGVFDGAGLLALGLHQAGLEHRWLCERDEWRRELLRVRFPGIPVYEDVRDIDVRCERVDWIAGGFPCKGVSTAGKRNGFDHEETVLWREMARAIRDLEPGGVVIENVANLLSLADGALWSEVLGDLAALGFDVEWDVLPAAAVGAPHLRERVFGIARHPDRQGLEGRGVPGTVADRPEGAPADAQGRGGQGARPGREALGLAAADRGPTAPDAGRDGVRQEQESERGCRYPAVAAVAGEAAPDPRKCGRRDVRPRQSNPAGVAVEWGDYLAAIHRWEAVHGPAPEPLVRRMDDGPADVRRLRSRVDRSRLSACGDGVHVYVGRLVGEYVMGLDEQRQEVAA